MGRTKKQTKTPAISKPKQKESPLPPPPIHKPGRLRRTKVDYAALANGRLTTKQEPIDPHQETQVLVIETDDVTLIPMKKPQRAPSPQITPSNSTVNKRGSKKPKSPEVSVKPRRRNTIQKSKSLAPIIEPTRFPTPVPRKRSEVKAKSRESKRGKTITPPASSIEDITEVEVETVRTSPSTRNKAQELRDDAKSRLMNNIEKELTVELSKLEAVLPVSSPQQSKRQSSPAQHTLSTRRLKQQGRSVKVSKHAAEDALQMLKAEPEEIDELIDVDEGAGPEIEEIPISELTVEEDPIVRRSRRHIPSDFPESISLRSYASNMGCMSPSHDENEYCIDDPVPFSPRKVVSDLDLPPCGKDFCRFGCLCDSIGTTKTQVAQHCGRIECIFGCICSEQELPERQSKLRARMRTHSLLSQFKLVRRTPALSNSKRSSRESTPTLMEIETVINVRRSKRSKARASVHAVTEALNLVTHRRSSAVSAANKVVGKAKKALGKKAVAIMKRPVARRKISFEPGSPILTRTRFPVQVVDFNSSATSTDDDESPLRKKSRLEQGASKNRSHSSNRPKSRLKVRALQRRMPTGNKKVSRQKVVFPRSPIKPVERSRRVNAGKHRRFIEEEEELSDIPLSSRRVKVTSKTDGLSRKLKVREGEELSRKLKISNLVSRARKMIDQDKRETTKAAKPVFWEDDEDRIHILPPKSDSNRSTPTLQQQNRKPARIAKVSRGVETIESSYSCARATEYVLTKSCARSRIYQSKGQYMRKIQEAASRKINSSNIASTLFYHQPKYGERLILMPSEKKSLLVLIRYEGDSLNRPSLKHAVLNFLKRKVEVSGYKHPGMKVARLGGCILELMPPIKGHSIPMPEEFLSRIRGDCLVLKACLSVIPGEQGPFRIHNGKMVRFHNGKRENVEKRSIGVNTDRTSAKTRHQFPLQVVDDPEDDEVVYEVLIKLVNDVCHRKLCDLPPSHIVSTFKPQPIGEREQRLHGGHQSGSATASWMSAKPASTTLPFVGQRNTEDLFASPASQISPVVPVHRLTPGMAFSASSKFLRLVKPHGPQIAQFQSQPLQPPAVVKVKSERSNSSGIAPVSHRSVSLPVSSQQPQAMRIFSQSTSSSTPLIMNTVVKPGESPVFIKVPLAKLSSSDGVYRVTPPSASLLPSGKAVQIRHVPSKPLEPDDPSRAVGRDLHDYQATKGKPKPSVLRPPTVQPSALLSNTTGSKPGSIHYQLSSSQTAKPATPPQPEHKRRKAPLEKRRGIEETHIPPRGPLGRPPKFSKLRDRMSPTEDVDIDDIDIESYDNFKPQLANLKQNYFECTPRPYTQIETEYMNAKHRTREQHRRKIIKAYFTRLADLVGAKYATKTTILDRSIEEVEKAKHGNWVLTQQVTNLTKRKNFLTSKLVKLKLATDE